MKIRNIKQKLIVGMAIVVGTTLLTAALAAWNPLNKWQLKLTNRLYDRDKPSEDIIIVGIDENSISSKGLGYFGEWNRYYTQLVEEMESAGAKVIAFDLFFDIESSGMTENEIREVSGKSETSDEFFLETYKFIDPETPHPADLKLAEVLQKYNNIIVADNLILDKETFTVEKYPIIEALDGKVKTSSVDNIPDEDEVFRRIVSKVYESSSGEYIPAFSFAVVEAFLGKVPQSVNDVLDEKGQMIINYAAPPFSFNILPFVDVYNGLVDVQNFRDKIVLVGVVADTIQDNIITPTSATTPMPGVEVHANAIQTILEEKYLTEQSLPSQIATIAALAVVMTTAVMLLGIIPGLVAAIALVAGYHLVAEPIFDSGIIVNLVYPTLALLTAYLITTLYKYTTETREKAKLRGAFSKYVNKDVVAKIMDNPAMLKLGGEKRTITVFFSDIVSFTSVSESISPDRLVPLLNEYLDVMTGIILKNGGTLDKFIGDAIMAFWGAPLEQKDHAILACKSALECRRALSDLHRKWQLEGKPLLNFRVGLSTGEAIVGNMGSSERFDYTAIGDIVNLGSRLEAANKEYGTHAMMSDATFGLIQETFETRRLDRLRVKGKEHPVDVYELLAEKGQLDETQRKVVAGYHQAIEYYRNQKFEEAKKRFQEVLTLVPNDGPAKTYLERCTYYLANPPGEGWDGTWTLDHK